MKQILFVCYGSGHVRMVLPVALAIQAAGWARVQVLALTTAAPVVRAAGLEVLQFKDFIRPDDPADRDALAQGRRLLADLEGKVDDPEESAAYLGLCWADLVDAHGLAEAERRYAERARQAFLPVRTLRRVLSERRPDLLVATNSPRAERAAIIAAGELGIPAVCLVDLFAIDEVAWIGQPAYASKVCVLNDAVRQFLIGAGRTADEIVVTGNPAFDALLAPEHRAAGAALRLSQGWEGQRVLLWASQREPAVHPFDGRPGDPTLPARALDRLIAEVMARDDVVLCVRPRPGEIAPDLPAHPRLLLCGQDWPLWPLLWAADMVLTLNSTVALEGWLTGTRVVQVLGSVFDHAMPLGPYGIADAAVPLDGLPDALAHGLTLPRRQPEHLDGATPQVLGVVRGLLDLAR